MSFPPRGFLFQPSVPLALHPCPSFGSGPGVILGPRTEELGRSASGSAFAPYSGSSAASPGFNSHLPYGGEPRAAATLGSFVSPGFDPSSGIGGSLDYHPFGPLGSYPYGDPAYRKNATRDATATLKAWLHEHRKNPYPTKGEKIMLAIVTKMTLTQVSTWFANARRRLKKENKMTWTPRNRSEDEDEEDGGEPEREEEEEEEVGGRAVGGSSEGTSCVTIYRDGGDATHLDFDCSGGTGRPPAPGPPLRQNTPEAAPLALKECVAPGPPPPKPKLWSLAEIATSSDKCRSAAESSSSGASRPPLPHGAALPRHLYYPSPFIPGYSGFGPLAPLQGGIAHLKGLHQRPPGSERGGPP